MTPIRRTLVLPTALVAAACAACAACGGHEPPPIDPVVDAPAPTGGDPDAAIDAGVEAPHACARTVGVATSDALATAIADARPGDCIVLADGTYGFPLVKAEGTAEQPIVITAAHRGASRPVAHGARRR